MWTVIVKLIPNLCLALAGAKSEFRWAIIEVLVPRSQAPVFVSNAIQMDDVTMNQTGERILHLSDDLRFHLQQQLIQAFRFGSDEAAFDMSGKQRIRNLEKLEARVRFYSSFQEEDLASGLPAKLPDHSLSLNQKEYQRLIWPRSLCETLFGVGRFL